MPWTETSPGVYSRPLGGVESAQVSLIAAERSARREPIKIHCLADFTAPYPLEKVSLAFRHAWKALRLLKSPDVATLFENGRTVYKVPSTQDLEKWLNETYAVAQTDIPVDNTVRETYTRQQWLPTLHLLPQSPQDGSFKGTLVLLISHWRTEAGGAFKLLNQLFSYASNFLTSTPTSTQQALAEHIPGSEVTLLNLCIEDILMPSTPSTPASASRIDAHMANYASHLPCIPFPTSRPLNSPSSTMQRLQRIYTPTSTFSLRSACKSHGVTITSAIHAAYLCALYHLASPTDKSKSYASMMPAQTRTRLEKSSPFRDQGCWASAQMLWLTSSPDQTFLERARGLRAQYELADSPTWLFVDAREVVKRTLHPSGEMPEGPVAMPWFTGIGLLDGETITAEYEGGWKVKRVAVWADNPGPGVVLGQWGFRGRLNLHLHWNEAFQDREGVGEVVDVMEGVLDRDFGVKMVLEEGKGEGEVY